VKAPAAGYPRFRFGEVVRVRRVSRSPADAPALTGQEATVSAFAPTRGGTTWSVGVRLPSVEEVWMFDEDDLESLGVVELEEGEAATRVPLDPETHVASFGADLSVRLLTEIPEGEAARVAAEAESAIRSIVAVECAGWRGEVHWNPPHRYDLTLDIWSEVDSREAFETVVASRGSGWTDRFDDGWSASFWWSSEADGSGVPFLVAEAGHVCVNLTPWSSPALRRVKRGRTHDPCLPGFTPPPPELGYEPE
jgi:hypothetical protein